MEMTFQTIGTNTYLNVEVGPGDVMDTMSLGMLTNNHIPGFAAVSFMQMDASKFIRYNVTSKISVSQLFSGPVNKKRLIGVFSGIVDAMMAAEDYMLDTNSLMLDLDYIFTDVSTCETVMVCLPISNTERKNSDLGMFFKNIIFNTQYDQTENCDHVAQIINYLNTNPVLVLSDFKELLEEIGKKKDAVQNAVPQQPKVQVVAERPVQQQPQVTVQQSVPVQVVEQPQNQTEQIKKHDDLQVSANSKPVEQVAKPVKKEKNVVAPAPQVQAEKTMSMFYLLQHYNKENAAIYKAQQEAKKAQKAEKNVPAQNQKKAPSKAAPPVKTPYAVPGSSQNAPNFAIPGQQAAPAATFAVPGKTEPVHIAPPAPEVVQKPVQPVVKPQELAPVASQPVPQQPKVAPQGMALNFGETTVLSQAIGETTVLSAAASPNRADPHLIRMKNNEKIPLNKPVFRIGKERSYVDYFIGDNTAISRSHANIINHNGEFFVVDTNSTNHTYVNGGMIQSNEEIKLSHGTKIRLANEDFEFKLY